MKKFLVNIYRGIRAPLASLLGKNEPAIVGGVLGVAATIATHYGLALTAQQQTYISSGVFLLITWVIRQLVTPATKVAITKDEMTAVVGSDASVTATPESLTVTHVHTHHHVNPPAKKAAPRKRTAKKATTRRR